MWSKREDSVRKSWISRSTWPKLKIFRVCHTYWTGVEWIISCNFGKILAQTERFSICFITPILNKWNDGIDGTGINWTGMDWMQNGLECLHLKLSFRQLSRRDQKVRTQNMRRLQEFWILDRDVVDWIIESAAKT